jgi:mannose/cellobiose epimerase-like protein (N-acyl-D-glucosamine 2-epimerase family)
MLKRKQTKKQDLAAEMPPGQYVYHPACHCSRCLEKPQAASSKRQASSNKRLTK